MLSAKKNSILTIPNMLTLLRILFVPLFLWMMLEHKPYESLLFFSLASVTDILDGFAARLWNLKSRFGTFLDPLADKLLMTTAVILITIPSISTPYALPLWLTYAIIGRDVFVSLGALLIFLIKGHKSFPPSLLGKTCTVAQVTTIFLVLLANYVQNPAGGPNPALPPVFSRELLNWAYAVTLGLTVFSWIHYFFVGISIMFPKKEKNGPVTNSDR